MSSESPETLMHDLDADHRSIYKSTCHKSPSVTQNRNKDKTKLITASIICLAFVIGELVGGIISNSLAVVSDAAHLLTDFGAFMVSLFAIWISSKPRTRKMSFGFYRAEVLGALISVLSIWLITGILFYMAIQRVINLDFEIDAAVMMYVSLGAIVANIIMGFSLVVYKDGGKIDISLESESINVRSAVIHVLGDLAQSVGVFIASIIIYFKPNLKVADPICTFIFSVIVLVTTLHILRDIVRVLMEGFPKHLNFSDVTEALFSVEGVVKVHNLRIWSLTIERVALSAHIVVSSGVDTSQVLRNASEIIHRELNIYEVTLQIEEEGDPACAVCT